MSLKTIDMHFTTDSWYPQRVVNTEWIFRAIPQRFTLSFLHWLFGFRNIVFVDTISSVLADECRRVYRNLRTVVSSRKRNARSCGCMAEWRRVISGTYSNSSRLLTAAFRDGRLKHAVQSFVVLSFWSTKR